MFVVPAIDDGCRFGHHFWQRASDLSKTRVAVELNKLRCHCIKLNKTKQNCPRPTHSDGCPCIRLRRFINSLGAIGHHDGQRKNELRVCVVSPQIFVCCWRVIARKIHETFSYLAYCDFYIDISINDVNRVSLLCFFCAIFRGICGVVIYSKYQRAKSQGIQKNKSQKLDNA